jgi:hypothetical protein
LSDIPSALSHYSRIRQQYRVGAFEEKARMAEEPAQSIAICGNGGSKYLSSWISLRLRVRESAPDQYRER